MSESTMKKQSELDASIDRGMDQFGRFVKLRWIWVILFLLIGWYVLFNIIPQLSIPAPGMIFTYAFQIMFAIMYILIQFVALFWFLGRPRLYWVMPGETGVGFEDYKGNPEVLESARRIVRLMQGVKAFREMGGKPVRGLLLSGPPGTGKSYLAQCISTEAGVPFAYASAASFRAMFIGMDVLMIKRLYAKGRRLAREYGGCVIFMDEFDAIGMSRSSGGGGNMAIGGGMLGAMGGTGGLNELLMQMDPPDIETGWFKKVLRLLGMYHSRVQNEPVLTIGATNIPDTLDPALLRPGRFDRQIRVDPPTDKYRSEVIEYYLKKVKHDPTISQAALVQRMVDYTPVAIKHVINEAVIIAHFDGREMVTYEDLIEAQDVHEYGLRQTSELTSMERRRLAYHEAGHAVACYYVMERYFPAYVTLHRRGGLEGAEAFVHPRAKETVKTQNKEEMLADIQVSLASRASEELFLNTNLNGVGGDFKHATEVATRYIGAYGMDGTLISILAFTNLTGSMGSAPNLMERVENLLQAQMKAVKSLLQQHSGALIAIAEALIERSELVADDIKKIIDDADAQQVRSIVLEEFQPLLGSQVGVDGNGNGNGHVVTHNHGVTSVPVSDAALLSYSNETFDMSQQQQLED